MNADTADIYQYFDAGLRRFLGRRLSDPAAVEDVLQETYLRIHRRAHDLREPGRLQGWVYQIAHNALVDHYRRQRETVELTDTVPVPSETDGENEAQQALARSMRDLLRCLPEKYGQALLLTEFERLTQTALAERLGLSLSGAKSRVQRAREKLREALLDCCQVELDRLGQVLHYEPRCVACADPHYFALRAAGAAQTAGGGCAETACG
jgi:RNA polymerase sigma-70 factor (ECF subfamily)